MGSVHELICVYSGGVWKLIKRAARYIWGRLTVARDNFSSSFIRGAGEWLMRKEKAETRWLLHYCLYYDVKGWRWGCCEMRKRARERDERKEQRGIRGQSVTLYKTHFIILLLLSRRQDRRWEDGKFTLANSLMNAEAPTIVKWAKESVSSFAHYILDKVSIYRPQ